MADFRKVFVDKYTDAVINGVGNTGLFPSVKMAQAILESADKNGIPGNSQLAKLHNNFFGIKAGKSWKGDIVNMPTREVINGKSVMMSQVFRKYAKPADSFQDHTNFLMTNKRYITGGVFSASTPELQASALQKSGYATDPNYATTLVKIIDKYNLKTLDEKKKIGL